MTEHAVRFAPSSRPAGSPPGTLHARVQDSVAAVFGIATERVIGSASLVDDLGATSLDYVELVMSLEESFAIEISDDDAARVVTVDDLENLIRRLQAGQARPGSRPKTNDPRD